MQSVTCDEEFPFFRLDMLLYCSMDPQWPHINSLFISIIMSNECINPVLSTMNKGEVLTILSY